MSRRLILVILLSSGIHPNPGPININTSQIPRFHTGHVFTGAFSDPASALSPSSSHGDVNHVSSQASYQDSSQVTNQVPNQAANQVPSQTINQVPNQTTSQAPNWGSSHVTNLVRNSATNQVPNQASNQVPNQATTQVPSQAANQVPNRATSQVPNLVINQSQNQVPNQASQASGQVSPSGLTFLQYNCNGVRNSLSELNNFLHENGVKVACLQETRLAAKIKDPSFPDYNLLRRDRPVGNGGGIAILIHHSVSFCPIDTSALTQGDDVMELLGISAKINGSPIIIFNIYIPPASS